MATLNAHTFSSPYAARDHYLVLVDAAASKARHIDPVQITLYQRKLEEAHQNGGPLLYAEAEVTGADISAVLAGVLREAKRWDQHINTIEIQRIAAKAAVRQASTAADMHRIYQNFQEAL